MLGSVELTSDGDATSQVEAAIKAALGDFEGAEVAIVAGGRRGGETNALIAKVQQKQMRDPFYLDPQAKESIRFALNGLTAKAFSTKRRALELAGELMLNAIGRNVEKQTNPNGSGFKGLTSNYAAYKRRKFGFVVPVLKATGDLLRGLKVRVKLTR